MWVAGGRVRLGFEAQQVTVEAYERLADAAEGAELVQAGHPVEVLRAVKDDDELELLRTACAISDQALADVMGNVGPGVTERETARLLEARMIELGADGPAFETIVAAGPNGAVPHHAPTGRLRTGDLVTVDFGACFGGYHADMTRTVVVAARRPPGSGSCTTWSARPSGPGGTRWRRAPRQREGRRGRPRRSSRRRPRRRLHARARARRRARDRRGPVLSPAAMGKLDACVPVTVEPGVYLPGRGGVRIEDTSSSAPRRTADPSYSPSRPRSCSRC